MNKDQLPFVSVIMPVRNEAAFIDKSLGAILAQDYPHHRLEVLVADGRSTDDTRPRVHQLSRQSDITVHLLDNPQQIVPTALNAAIARARGEIIVRVDGHTIIAPDYVRHCVADLQRTGADNVGGKMTAIGDNWIGTAVALATSAPFGVGGARFHYADSEEFVDTVYLGAWRRELFDRLGGFDEEMVRNQDDEFNYRLLKHGGRILLSPRIHSRYTPRHSLRALARQYYQYGYWKVRVMQKHPQQMRPRQFAPPLFVLALGVTSIWALFSRRGRRALAGLVLPYGTANAAASLATAARHDWLALPLLPLVFTTLHLSYGAGFLRGLLHFRRRWRQETSDHG